MTPLWMRNVQTGYRGLFYHKSGVWEKSLSGEGGTSERNRVLRGLMRRHLHHAEIFLRDEMPFQEKAKLVASEAGKTRERIHVRNSWCLFSSAEYPVVRYGDEGGENPP